MVKNLSILVLVLSIICIAANVTHSAEYWAKSYGGSNSEYASSIQQTTDGGYIVAGFAWSFGAGEWDIWVLKFDSNGTVSWQKNYGGTDDETAYSIQQTIDGGYIVAGGTKSFGAGNTDIWVLKLDSNGNVIWQKTYGWTGDDLAKAIQQTSDGGYIISGYTNSFGAGLGDLWVLKLDSNGNVTWQKTYGDIENEGGNSIQQTTDGGYIISGSTDSFSAVNYDFWVLKIDSNGNVSWQKTYGGSDLDYAYSIQQTFNQDEEPDGYIVAGTTVSFGVGYGYNVWILKLDSNGEVSWQKTYGGSPFDEAWSIHQTSDRGYIVTGYTGSFGAGEWDIWVLKLATNGDVTWQKTYGGSGYEKAFSIQQTTDGGYIVAGSTDSFGAGYEDFWVLKLDSNGEMSDCDIIGSSDAIVSNTIIYGQNSSASISSPSATITNTNVLPQDSSGTIFTVCPWIDSDGDGVPDGMHGDTSCIGGEIEHCADNCPEIPNIDQSDTDSDRIGNICDNCPNDSENDIDEDNICGDVDNCPNDYNLSQIDTDLDEIGDICDNCPNNSNKDQQDNDLDGVGDVCDNCPVDYNPNQEDADGDDIGDVCDPTPTSSSTTTSNPPQPPPNTTTSIETTSSSTSTSSATTTEPTTTTTSVLADCMLNISISPAEGGTTSPPPPQYFVMGCHTVTVEALPNPGYTFSHWEGGAQGSNNPITIEIAGTLSITAVFVLDICPIEGLYGEDSDEVEILRCVRDNVLSQTPEGQEITKLYYQWSPAIVRAMEEDEEFKEEVKEMIDGVLSLISGERE